MTSCATKSVSILVHWNKSLSESETAAQALYSALQSSSLMQECILNNTVNEEIFGVLLMQC